MNTLKNTLLATVLLSCAAGAFAAPTNHEARPQSGPKPCHGMMMPPPAPIYAVSQQTDDPKAALDNVVKNVPELEKGKKYEIRVVVKELPAKPERAPAPAPVQ
ncbi:hypothetical protein [Entomohabitans teleogrylli]|uniref:hypothetical protein n=1 Tax=Entomohabitans teleogrylli TaxID=1384589 RepID=UPI00073D509E|nr:hypothetical protein [Entomohabitans teleogrylli]